MRPKSNEYHKVMPSSCRFRRSIASRHRIAFVVNVERSQIFIRRASVSGLVCGGWRRHSNDASVRLSESRISSFVQLLRLLFELGKSCADRIGENRLGNGGRQISTLSWQQHRDLLAAVIVETDASTLEYVDCSEPHRLVQEARHHRDVDVCEWNRRTILLH